MADSSAVRGCLPGAASMPRAAVRGIVRRDRSRGSGILDRLRAAPVTGTHLPARPTFPAQTHQVVPMKIGVARETAPGERRVALVPDSLAKLTAAGVEVLVEQDAGRGALIP